MKTQAMAGDDPNFDEPQAASSGSSGWLKAVAGAAAAGVGVGLVASGPIAAVALGGAAVYATTRSDGVGEAARSVGTGTANAVSAAKKYNEEHNVTGRIAEGASQVYEGAKSMDERHQVLSSGLALIRLRGLRMPTW